MFFSALKKRFPFLCGMKTRILVKLRLLDRDEVLRRQREADQKHPERLAVLAYCSEGRGLDIGCGHRKTSPNCIGIDITPRGSEGKNGCVAGQVSEANVCASGDDLHMFADGEMDFIVARHNLEHYVDPVKALQEWRRVLRSGGVIALVLPDERCVDTISLDPTHKHVFTPESIRRLLELVEGFEIVRLEEIIHQYSFLCVCRKTTPAG